MAESNKTGKIKVLIVEDEMALRDIYSTKLLAEGFEVEQASDGSQGLNQAINFQPDVIMLDIVMPIKNGFEVLEDLKLNPKTKDIPVVIMSNLGQTYEIKRGMSLGAEAFLTKANIVPSAVVEKINEVLKKG
jgi:DNA-binding response OmpR family regulator